MAALRLKIRLYCDVNVGTFGVLALDTDAKPVYNQARFLSMQNIAFRISNSDKTARGGGGSRRSITKFAPIHVVQLLFDVLSQMLGSKY